MHADDKEKPVDIERRVDPHSTRRSDEEIVVSRDPVYADAPPIDVEMTPDRRRSERRKIDRMSTGI